jgi:hypothetical protein
MRHSLFPSWYGRAGVVLILTATSLLGDWVPSIHSSNRGSPSNWAIQFGHAAHAQTISNDELENYASAVLVIEPLRQAVYNEMRSVLGTQDTPSVACHRPDSIRSLDIEVRDIARNYCDRAIRIVERNNLTIQRFNAITQELNRAGQNSPIHNQIQRELIRLQQD